LAQTSLGRLSKFHSLERLSGQLVMLQFAPLDSKQSLASCTNLSSWDDPFIRLNGLDATILVIGVNMSFVVIRPQ
jgi:hypothetical protein